MNQLHTLILKTGDSITFQTDMPEEELKSLPPFANQHQFNCYFQSKGYQVEVEIIMKKAP